MMPNLSFGTTLGSFGAGLVSGPVLCDWAEEIERRVSAIEAGTADLEPWEIVKRRVESEILGR